MQLPALVLCAAAMVMTFGLAVLWQGLRLAPVAVEDENGFHVIRTNADTADRGHCDVERHTLWP